MAALHEDAEGVCSEAEEALRLSAVERLDEFRKRLDDANGPDERDAVHQTIADELAALHTNLAGCAAALLSTRLRPPKQSSAWKALLAVCKSDPASRNGADAAVCLRLSAQVAAHWGASVVQRYAWASRARSFLERLWSVARVHEEWEDAVGYLNAVLVLRQELVLSGRLSASTRTWQTIGHEAEKGAPRLRYSPVTAADLKNVMDWTKDGFLKLGGRVVENLEEAERTVTHWTTATADTIQLCDGSYLSDRPHGLWTRCMIACDPAGLVVREDTLQQPPRRTQFGQKRPAKRPRLDGDMTAISLSSARNDVSEEIHGNEDFDCSVSSPLAVWPTEGSSTDQTPLKLGEGQQSLLSGEPSVGLQFRADEEQTDGDEIESNDSDSGESLDDPADDVRSEGADSDDDIGPHAVQAAANSTASSLSEDDVDMSSDRERSEDPSTPGTAQTEVSAHSPVDEDDQDDGTDDNETQGEKSPQSDDVANTGDRADAHSLDCPLCPGRCKAGFVPNIVTSHDEKHRQRAIQLRLKAFEQIHAIYELILESSGTDVKSHILKKWASPTHIASVFFDPDEHGLSTASRENADAWYLTAQRLQAYGKDGIVLNRPVVIKGAVRDAGWLTWDDCYKQLRSKLTGRSLQVRSAVTHLLEDIDGDDFLEMLPAPESALNALDLPGLIRGDRPAFTLLPHYRLLEDLVCSEAWNDAKKQVTTKELDLYGCLSFNILGLRGAFSGAHLDVLNGTWVRAFCGRKAWMFVPPDQVEENDLRRLARDGDDYDPRGKARTLIIEADEVLLLPPGAKIIHAVLTTKTSLMEGGMLWDDSRILEILCNMLWMAKNQQATNEAWPNQIQAVIRQLDRAVVSDPERFAGGEWDPQDFVREYEKLSREIKDLPCKCSSRCGRRCPCKTDRRRRTPECNSHAGRLLACCKEK
ncbi:hypothetical protein M409DRAFT_54164 [Zasmidium cellare ATCC 36951]|uniref:JmjC domain-containing protein n=1 Tax=Zasmidium cellare ATCC 36951 TaxID=1080233 RepID=A0A6A6CKK0_ZASCE|nr:uncharacterized protein M409DRAFT_54164 [Zasmidium cellare ATCC 36951]KAF2167571.1 hypothetical protein M409DRAFT_54164 [Zasmidium cellare ATCC 36951]